LGLELPSKERKIKTGGPPQLMVKSLTKRKKKNPSSEQSTEVRGRKGKRIEAGRDLSKKRGDRLEKEKGNSLKTYSCRLRTLRKKDLDQDTMGGEKERFVEFGWEKRQRWTSGMIMREAWVSGRGGAWMRGGHESGIAGV